MADKVKSEDFINAFGEGVKQMENVKPIVIDCKYYLPCGRCDKTNEMCSQLDGIVLPIKPNGATTTKSNEISVNPSFYIPVNNGGVTPV